MAEKMAFAAQNGFPWVRREAVSVPWASGMNIVRRRMNVSALHDAYRERCPQARAPEVSRYSTQPGATVLSAFNLQKFVPSMGRSVSVEWAYQGG